MRRLRSGNQPILLLLFYFSCNVAQGQIQEISQELHKLSIIKDSVSLVNSLNRLGTLYGTRNTDSCFYYGIQAKRLATKLQYRKGQAEADLIIARAFYKRGLYAESLELLGKILPFYQRLGDTEKIIRVYLAMVEVLSTGIDKAKATGLLQQVIQTGQDLKKDSIMSEVYMNYCSRNATLLGDSIHYYLDKSKEIASRYNDKRLLKYHQLWQARLLILDGQIEEARPLVRQLRSEAQRIGNPNLEINSLFLMVGLYENEPRNALQYFYQAYEVAQKSGDRQLEIYILNNALEVAKQLGDKDEIINVHIELQKAMSAEWDKSKKFISDYVRYNAVQDDNKLLSEDNARRAAWLVIISLSSAIILISSYLVMLSRHKKARALIEALNDTANMQIIAMEEAKHQAVRAEQQRLGQDLHDGLCSSIAAIRNQLETLMMDTGDITLKNKLTTLQVETANAYEAARSKSHEWFSASDSHLEQSFERQIKLLTDSALPDSRYNKEIHIDHYSLLCANTDIRIALLRIIQEAITNIIKHAKAKNVGILIYEEMDNLVLAINDDGKGLGEKESDSVKSTMGLRSIHRRVQYLNGEVKIHSDTHGTEIIVSIPLQQADR